MDSFAEDRDKVRRGVCPNCGITMTYKMPSGDINICKNCDLYWTIVGDWVCRNPDAMRQYDRELKEFMGET